MTGWLELTRSKSENQDDGRVMLGESMSRRTAVLYGGGAKLDLVKCPAESLSLEDV